MLRLLGGDARVREVVRAAQEKLGLVSGAEDAAGAADPLVATSGLGVG